MDILLNIPVSLKHLQQWVSYVSRPNPNGKTTKIPVNPKTGAFASVSDPATWGTFTQACERCQYNPDLNGEGFVFSAADPYLGIDFDACRDPESGAIAPAVLNWVSQLDSYTEISVSGTGLHVIVTASLPQGGCRRGSIEMYDQRRFFVVTGRQLPDTPADIRPRQAQVNRLHQALFAQAPEPHSARQTARRLLLDDETLVKRIRASRQGPKFERLLDGSTAGYDSPSQADLALCAILAFWTRDAAQIDRIFRTSGLYRDKWDAERGETHYGALTILRALGQR